MSTQPTPSHEAIALAVKLSGHTHCQKAHADTRPLGPNEFKCYPCDGCLGDAETIDRELQLPARTAALLCAQGLVDMVPPEAEESALAEAIDQLRVALARISTR